MVEPVPSKVIKVYPQRGPLQQFRFADATAFACFRCGEAKKSKLITVYGADWAKRLCNGCYGRLLSLYEIKAGTDSEEQKVEALASALFLALAVDIQRQAERQFQISERRANVLSAEALRFVATAEHVAKRLEADPQLEWSPAIIGLCKAVEVEVVCRILRPLAACMASTNLSSDKADKDLGRVAMFCADPSRKPPELGAFAHFLQTVIHSQQRRGTSALIGSFLKLIAEWANSHWLLDSDGLTRALAVLTSDFRNRAAHIDELGKEDYLACREMVIGSQGILWRLVLST